MSWLYYTETTPLSWKDRVITDYLRSKGVELKIMSIDQDIQSQDVKIHGMKFGEDDGMIPDRIILSNLFEKKSNDAAHYYDFFLPLLLSELCARRDIHFTYLAQEYVSNIESKWYVRKLLEMKRTLYLNFWILMNHDMQQRENGLVDLIQHPVKYCTESHYHVSVCADVFPIVHDMIEKQKLGAYEMTNPTSIQYGKILGLYCEYMSTQISDATDDISAFYPCHLNVDTTQLEKEYFILPSYQALQRLIKRVRKSNMIKRDISLNSKCSILVTGGYGFIGSNLVHFLYHQFPKCQIINIDRLDYCSRKENLDDLLESERVKCYQIDLCETQQVQDILCRHRIDYVFHLAAQSHVDNSFNNSLQFSRDNMYGTHSLLEACKNYGRVIRFLHVSTDEIYGETLQMNPFAEDELPNPTNPYAATKVGAEYIVKSYFHCFELPIIIVRGNNVYGPRQFPEKMIPKFITSVLQQTPCTVAGNGLMQRNFIYVEDVCRGLVAVMENGVIDEIYNIGSDDEKSVIAIAKTIIRTMTDLTSDKDIAKYIVYVKDRYYNDFRYSINSQKIRKLGWKPKMTFEEGLGKTIQFYTENLELYNRENEMEYNKVMENDESSSDDEHEL